MEKEFVTYDLALRMKALGFNEHCFAIFDCDTHKLIQNILCQVENTCTNEALGTASDVVWITAPTWQSAFEWFEEKYNIDSFIEKIFKDEYGYTITSGGNEPINRFDLDTKKEAQQACLEKLCEIVEKKKEDGGKL